MHFEPDRSNNIQNLPESVVEPPRVGRYVPKHFGGI